MRHLSSPPVIQTEGKDPPAKSLLDISLTVLNEALRAGILPVDQNDGSWHRRIEMSFTTRYPTTVSLVPPLQGAPGSGVCGPSSKCSMKATR